MTMSTTRPQPPDLHPESDRATTDRRPGTWRLVAIILGVVALGLTALVISNAIGDDEAAPAADQAVVPSEVTQLLDDYETAWEQADGALLEAITTEDFFFTSSFYVGTGPEPAFEAGGPLFSAIDSVESSTYEIERFGEAIVAGDGPWFVNVGETWTDPSNRYDGTASYVIVDDGGTPRISTNYWAGVKIDVPPDWTD